MKTAEEIGARILATLASQARRNKEAGAAVRAEIAAVMAAHPNPALLTAKQIHALLLCDQRPSIRRIQEHMHFIRAESSASRKDKR